MRAKSEKRKAKKPAPPHRLSRRQWAVLIVAALSLAILGGGWYGLRAAWAYAVNLPEFQVQPGNIRLHNQPFVDAEAFRQDLLRRDRTGFLRETGDTARRHSLLDADLAARAAAAYEQSPWVRRTLRVERVFPNRLRVDLDLRVPYVAVQCDGRTYLLDRDGMCLDPAIYTVAPESLERAPVTLERAERFPAPGEVWRDDSVRMGLDMTRYMEAHAEAFARADLTAVDVRSGRGGKDRLLVLRTAHGPAFTWGASPYQTTGADAEVAADVKLRALSLFLKKPVELQAVDLRWDRPVGAGT